MISSTTLISSYFIRDTGRASSQPSGNLSNSFPDGIPVGNLIQLMRREFPMGSHKLLFGYRFLSCSDPKLNLGTLRRVRLQRPLLAICGLDLTGQPRLLRPALGRIRPLPWGDDDLAAASATVTPR